MQRPIGVVGLVAVLAAAGVQLLGQSRPPAPPIDDEALRRAAEREGEWITHGRTYAEERFSPLTQINDSNVAGLKLAWSADLPTRRGLEATPLIVDGIMYATGSWSMLFAFDARTGKQIWSYDPEVPRTAGANACCDVVNRGAAYYKGHLFFGTIDGRLVAVDASTGRRVWETPTTEPRTQYTITGAPRVVKGQVIIGNGGADYGARGYVSAYDASTGKMTWRLYTVPGDPSKPQESPALERALHTWAGKWWEVGGGGTVWDAIAFDPELDLLYVGTGNGSPWSRAARSDGEGDNLYLSSILALRPSTGELVWHYQTTPGDDWDFTATQHIVLADLPIGGRTRQVLMQAPKNGFFYVLDRKTGELLSAKNFVPVNWATGIDMATGRPIETPTARYAEGATITSPGPLGAHNWHPMSFSPKSGLVYIPAQENSSNFSRDPEFVYKPRLWNTGLGTAVAKGERVPPRGYLLAWDPVAQAERWRVDHPQMWNGGLLSTAGNLVFQGTGDGRFLAFKADTGATLLEVKVGAGIIAPPVSYQVGDEQFVSVMVGWGGVYALGGANPSGQLGAPGRILTFSLNGTAAMPTYTTATTLPPPPPIASDAAPELVARGAQVYARNCSRCHGAAAAGNGGLVMDLRRSSPAVFERYRQIVVDGAAENRGMPAFRPYLSYEDADALRAYVLDRRAALSKPAATKQ